MPATLTPQRRAVLEALRASHDHPTAADVYERVRGECPGIGAATVYRSLAFLVNAGYASELRLERGAARFDANTTRHDHLICDRCEKTIDVEALASPLELATDLGLRELADRSGFTITAYDLRLRGRCPECQHD